MAKTITKTITKTMTKDEKYQAEKLENLKYFLHEAILDITTCDDFLFPKQANAIMDEYKIITDGGHKTADFNTVHNKLARLVRADRLQRQVNEIIEA